MLPLNCCTCKYLMQPPNSGRSHFCSISRSIATIVRDHSLYGHQHQQQHQQQQRQLSSATARSTPSANKTNHLARTVVIAVALLSAHLFALFLYFIFSFSQHLFLINSLPSFGRIDQCSLINRQTVSPPARQIASTTTASAETFFVS